MAEAEIRGKKTQTLEAVKDLMEGLYTRSGSQLLRQILDLEDPKRFVRSISGVDFYWLIKRIGEDEALPLLELASTVQWMHVLDLELWVRDRIDNGLLCQWFDRLLQADPERFVKMLFLEEGELLASFFAFKNISSVAITKDEAYEVPDDLVTLDGTIYFQARDEGLRDTVLKLLKYMAMKDFERYFTFMTNYSGIIPAETEEELLRLRNARLAEYGFLPFEEAISVYAPLAPEKLLERTEGGKVVLEEEGVNITYYPMVIARQGQNLLPKVMDSVRDPLLLDRLRIEFTGLLNQLVSAEPRLPRDHQELIRYCLKASRYLNLAFERFLREGEGVLLGLLERHHLADFFRVGVHMVMRLSWEVHKWMPSSWFLRKGLDYNFWGETWGPELKGLLYKRPLYYSPEEEGEYKDFEWIKELGQVAGDLNRIMVLDGLLEKLEAGLGELKVYHQEDFRAPLFTLWARQVLQIPLQYQPLTLGQFREFFVVLRKGSDTKPFDLKDWKSPFLEFFKGFVVHASAETKAILEETLILVFLQFVDEYKWVSTGDLDPRFCPYLLLAER